MPRSLRASLSVNASEQGSSRPKVTMLHYKLGRVPSSTRAVCEPGGCGSQGKARLGQVGQLGADMQRMRKIQMPGAKGAASERGALRGNGRAFRGTRASANTSGPDFNRA